MLATGSIYLVGDLLGTHTRSSDCRPITVAETAMNDDGPSVLAMIAHRGALVALMILVFFAAGYGFGRLFL